MSHLSEQCKKDLAKDDKDVVQVLGQFRANLPGMVTDPERLKQLMLAEDFQAKMQDVAWNEILCARIQQRHKEVYGGYIYEGKCMCNLCVLGWHAMFDVPHVKRVNAFFTEAGAKPPRAPAKAAA